jgi:hypothetical protein
MINVGGWVEMAHTSCGRVVDDGMRPSSSAKRRLA